MGPKSNFETCKWRHSSRCNHVLLPLKTIGAQSPFIKYQNATVRTNNCHIMASYSMEEHKIKMLTEKEICENRGEVSHISWSISVMVGYFCFDPSRFAIPDLSPNKNRVISITVHKICLVYLLYFIYNVDLWFSSGLEFASMAQKWEYFKVIFISLKPTPLKIINGESERKWIHASMAI